MMHPSRSALVAAAAILLLAAPGPLDSQTGQTGQQTTRQQQDTPRESTPWLNEGLRLQAELLEMMQTRGMSAAQVRQELARRGYPASLFDPYMDETVQRPPNPNAQVLRAARALGLMRPLDLESDTLPELAEPPLELADSTALERERGLRIFGPEIFGRAGTEFESMTMGPVPSSYVLGPGDELVLFLTGDVEYTYTLPVSREGFVVIPQVGQVSVNGLTLSELREQLYARLGRAYSGVRRGPEATTHFQVTLGQLRPSQVFVTGQVARPGVVLVDGVASALNALYRAGGPTVTGSFRDVRIMRAGRLAERLDLYDYLMGGDNLSGTRLEPGDVLFVPPGIGYVSVHGEVVRPAIYEIRPGETVMDLIQFAGGLNAPAHVRRVRIARILPPHERSEAGLDRVVLDVDLTEAMLNPAAAPALEPGDAVTIFPVRAEVRNTVTIGGSVWRPGNYRYVSGMRAWDLIERAEGLSVDAYLDRAQVVRLSREDSTRSMMSFSLRRGPDGHPLENPVLMEYDTVHIHSARTFTTHFPVTITGEVRSPVQDTFFDGMTLRDLVFKADGLRPSADLIIEIARMADPTRRDTRQLAEVIHVEADASFFVSEQDRRHYLGTLPTHNNASGDFLLKPYDRVMVRPLPELEFQRSVVIRGEVRHPGAYTLQRKDERLSNILERAGGLTDTAFPAGTRFYRDSVLVNLDLPSALRRPDGPANLIMLPGDSIVVPEYNPVVLVQGAVNSPDSVVAVLYREGAGLDYYIQNAGGYARYADKRGVNVRHANGSGEVVTRRFGFRRTPTPTPGSTIVVPAVRPEDRFDTVALFRDLAQIAGALTTVVLLVQRF